MSDQVYSLLDQIEEERTVFFREYKKGGHPVRLAPGELFCYKI